VPPLNIPLCTLFQNQMPIITVINQSMDQKALQQHQSSPYDEAAIIFA